MAKVEVSPNDPRTRASTGAIQQALSWYARNLAQAPGAPFDARRADELCAALRDSAPCTPELFDVLVNFGRLMHRLSGRPGVAACNIGDVLEALATLPPSVGALWEHDRTVDDATSAKLGFTATSKGIADAQANNRDTWRSHTERCRSFIQRAADLPRDKGTAVILGVGHAFDVPLASLACSYDRLVLIDVDAEVAGATAEALLRTEGLRARIETKDPGSDRNQSHDGLDPRRGDQGIEGPRDRANAHRSVRALVQVGASTIACFRRARRSARSSCVLSQLAWPQRAYALTRLHELGAVVGDAERSWSRAWFELELRVQQDHIRMCTEASPITVLVSDMVNRLTAIDPSGLECPTGQKIFTMGVDSLFERIPQALRAEEHASWIWPRHRPGPSGQPGSWMEVEGLVLYDRLKTMA